MNPRGGESTRTSSPLGAENMGRTASHAAGDWGCCFPGAWFVNHQGTAQGKCDRACQRCSGTITSVGEDAKNGSPQHTADGMEGGQPLWETVWQFLDQLPRVTR